MSTEQTLDHPEAVVNGRNEGHHLHFLNHLATVKYAPGSTGSMSVVEFVATRAFGPPQHIHREEDELFLVLEGELRLMTGSREIAAGEGAMAVLPRAVPHTFQVVSGTARFVNVTASPTTTPRFDAMVSALGSPTDMPTLPEPGYIDPARVAEVCAVHGIDIVGPPPAPLP
jgi:mannose-6-phosphate isomerase-like protein (cupin superfamily)